MNRAVDKMVMGNTEICHMASMPFEWWNEEQDHMMLNYRFFGAIQPGGMHTEKLRTFGLQYAEIQLTLWHCESEKLLSNERTSMPEYPK